MTKKGSHNVWNAPLHVKTKKQNCSFGDKIDLKVIIIKK